MSKNRDIYQTRAIKIAAASAIAGLLSVAQIARANPPSGDNYNLVFDDDFSQTNLDTSKWTAASPSWTMPNSASTAAASQVSVGNGMLTLNATRTSSTAFSSGSVSSYSTYNFTGGYIEARIQLPSTVGSWPAFWGLYTGWPPEADIMEYPLTTDGGTDGLSANQYNTNYHYSTSSGDAAGAGPVTTASSLAGTWHTFGMDWITSTDVVFYLDGQEVSSYYGSSVSQMAYMYMILDYAVGGWPGTPSTTQWPLGYSDQTNVDWVRVWQTNPTGATSTSWNINGNGAFGTSSNWTSATPAYGNETAVFGRVGTAASATVTMNPWQLFGGITFSGLTSGSLAGTTSYTLGTASNEIQLSNSAGATIQAAATSTTAQTINAAVEFLSNTSVTNNMTAGENLNLNGNLSGIGTLIVSGASPVVLAGTNTYSGGTTIGTQGRPAILEATSNSALGTGPVTFDTTGNASTARLELVGNTTQANSILLSGRNNTSVAIENLSGNNTLTGTITAGIGGGDYILQSDAGSLTLSNSTALTSNATGTRTITLQGAGNGNITGAITNGTATLGLTVAGPGAWTLSGSNTFTGPTAITGGTLALAGNGTLATSSGITINGPAAKFLQTNSAGSTPAITLTNGTLDGTASVGPISVASNANNIVTNGNGGFAPLTMSSLNFAGSATDNVRILGGTTYTQPGQQVTGLLTTPSTTDAITLNVATNGVLPGTYDLIGYNTLAGGGTSAFSLGTTAGLGNNETATLGASNSNLTLIVAGNIDQFTGADNNTWQAGATGPNHNFQLSPANTPTDFANNDVVRFDDTPQSTGTFTVNIASPITPALTWFSNSNLSYTISSTSGYGIGGAGALIKDGAGTVKLTTVNTFTGPTTVNSGTLYAAAPNTSTGGALSGTSGVIVNAGATLITSENGLFGSAIANEKPITLNANSTLTSDATTDSTHLGSLTLAGGTLTYPGSPTGDGSTYGTYDLDGGVIAGGTSTTSTISAPDLALTQTGGTIFNVASGTTPTGIDLTITGSILHFASGDTGLIKSGNGTMQLTGADTYTSATTVAGGNLQVSGLLRGTSSITIGNTPYVGAAMYQTGGVVSPTSAASAGIQIGAAPQSAGYFNLSAGTLSVASEIDIGGSGGAASTFAQLDITGGTLNLPNSSSSYFAVNRGLGGETAIVNILGGKVQIANNETPSDNGYDGLAMNWSQGGTAQSATVTIANGGQFLTPSLTVKVNNGGNNGAINNGFFTGNTGNAANVATLNLNAGGTLQTLGFLPGNDQSNVNLNFNGGTLKAGNATNATFLNNLGSATLYAAGGTFDNNGQSITIAQPLASATGFGVAAVALTNGGTGYIVPPQVTFTGGNGTGAAAYATINPATGAVTGIVITNPGTGFTSAPAITLTPNVGGTGATTGTVSTATNTAGTLTLQGAGTTTLTGASTFTGNIIINAGTVDAANDVNISGRATGALGNPSISGRTVTINNASSLIFTQGNILGTGSQTTAPALSFIVNQGGLLETAAADVGAGGGGDANIFGNITLSGGTMTVGNGANAAYQSAILLGTVTAAGTAASTINTNATNTADNGVMLSAPSGVTFNVATTGAPTSDLAISAPLVNAAGGTAKGSLIKSGPGTMELSGANTYTGLTTVQQGTLMLDIKSQSPILTAGGANIQAGSLIFNYTGGADPIATIQTDLTASFNASGGAFTSGQIHSSTAVAGKYGLGYADNITTDQVTVMYTLYGDANLDGVVDAADFVALSNNFGKTGTTWSQGNFNYDNTTDAADFVLLSNNFGQSITGAAVQYLDPSELTAYNQEAAALGFSSAQIATWDVKLSGVPEPTSLLLAAIAATGLLRRQNRFSKHLCGS